MYNRVSKLYRDLLGTYVDVNTMTLMLFDAKRSKIDPERSC